MTEPPFKSDAELVQYVESQIRLVLSAGWRLERLEGELFGWRIVPPGEGWNDYILRIGADRAGFVFLHGNSDAGPIGLHQVLLNAKVADLRALQWFSLSQMLEHVIETCEPNRWGLT